MSALRCKPGDLAIVVKCNSMPEEIEMIVHVLEFVTPGRVFEFKQSQWDGMEMPSWLVKTCGKKFKRIEGNKWSGKYSDYEVYADHLLLPIRPGEEPASTEESTSLPAPEVTA